MLARLRSVAACGPLWRGRAVQLEQLVTELVQSGRYRSAGEVVREGLRLPAVRDESDRAKLEALRRMIQEGIDSGPAAPLGRCARCAQAASSSGSANWLWYSRW